MTPFSWTHELPSVLAARTIFSELCPGSLAIRFRVLVRATLAQHRHAGGAALCRESLEPRGLGAADEHRRHPVERPHVRVVIATNLLARHVEGKDDSRGPGLARRDQLLMQRGEVRPRVVRVAREVGRQVETQQRTHRAEGKRTDREVANDHLARRIRGGDLLIRREIDERASLAPLCGRLGPVNRSRVGDVHPRPTGSGHAEPARRADVETGSALEMGAGEPAVRLEGL